MYVLKPTSFTSPVLTDSLFLYTAFTYLFLYFSCFFILFFRQRILIRIYFLSCLLPTFYHWRFPSPFFHYMAFLKKKKRQGKWERSLGIYFHTYITISKGVSIFHCHVVFREEGKKLLTKGGLQKLFSCSGKKKMLTDMDILYTFIL